MKSIATFSGVSFEFPNGRRIFENLNFSLESKIYGLVGPNGVGKTCLARLLAGELSPLQGKILHSSPITFFPQREEPPSVRVEEYLGVENHWSLLREKLLEKIPRESLCSNLSGGQWMRVRLARILNDRFLILDEPTNDLDRQGRRALVEFLQMHSGGALLISHDRECLSLCEEILELSNQGFSKFGMEWAEYSRAKEKEREGLHQSLEIAKRERDSASFERSRQKARQEKRNRQGAKSSATGGMPKILLGARKRRAQTTTGRIDSMTLEKANESVREAFDAFQELKIDPVMYASLMGQEIPSQKLVAEARGFNIRFQNWIFPEDLNFCWRGNVRVAIKGANGSGKSTLFQAILAKELETRGEIRRGSLRTLSIDQSCSQLDDAKSVFENVLEKAQSGESEVRKGLAKFLFTNDLVFQKVSDLSGGERLRAALAQGFLSQEKPEVLILDEPTNNLDLVNVQFLENLVRQFRGALLVISHDEIFLENCEIQEEFRIAPI